MAVAAALRVNSSLRELYLFDNQPVDRTRIDAAFIEALRLNTDRPAWSAWYLYSSEDDFYTSTITSLDLRNNQFSSATYLALAALHVNGSLQVLLLYDNQAVDEMSVEAALVEALRLNLHRPAESKWLLYTYDWMDIDFKRLKDVADQLGHPSLQMMLMLDMQH